MKTTFPHPLRIVLVAALLPLLTTAAAESPSLLLQKGIYAEEIERNLNSAIKIYEQIAAESAANRAVVAQAQYRLAMCYRKQGKKEEAIKLLNELVHQSPGEADIAKKARETLAELGVALPEKVRIRQIPFPAASWWFMSISADGRYVAYQPKDTHDLAVCDVVAGKNWTVVKGRDQLKPGSEAAISSNGQWIAYDLNHAQIYLAKIDGSETRKVFDVDSGADKAKATLEYQWSGSDAEFLFGVYSSSVARMFSLDANTGNKSEIELPPPLNVPGGGAWAVSPSKRYVARISNTYPSNIAVLNLKSRLENRVATGNIGTVVGWTSGETQLVFTKNTNGSIDLWSVDLKEGAPMAEPRLLWKDWGIIRTEFFTVTPNGNIYYSVPKGKGQAEELWVMEGFVSRKTSNQALSGIEIPPEEILTSNHSILDRKLGVSFTYPANWTIQSTSSARRRESGNTIRFNVPEFADAIIMVQYRGNPNPTIPGPPDDPNDRSTLRRLNTELPDPRTEKERDAWLTRFTDIVTESKKGPHQHWTDYEIRPDSIGFRTIGSGRAVSYVADYHRLDTAVKTWTEYHTTVHDAQTVVDFSLQSKVSDLDKLRPLFDAAIETLRLP